MRTKHNTTVIRLQIGAVLLVIALIAGLVNTCQGITVG